MRKDNYVFRGVMLYVFRGFLVQGASFACFKFVLGGILTLILVLKKNKLSGGYIFMLLICPRGTVVWLNYVLRGHYQ